MNTGASAPMIVAFAMLVSRKALNVNAMSKAKNTPPSAHTRITDQRTRRPVKANTTA